MSVVKLLELTFFFTTFCFVFFCRLGLTWFVSVLVVLDSPFVCFVLDDLALSCLVLFCVSVLRLFASIAQNVGGRSAGGAA